MLFLSAALTHTPSPNLVPLKPPISSEVSPRCSFLPLGSWCPRFLPPRPLPPYHVASSLHLSLLFLSFLHAPAGVSHRDGFCSGHSLISNCPKLSPLTTQNSKPFVLCSRSHILFQSHLPPWHTHNAMSVFPSGSRALPFLFGMDSFTIWYPIILG